MFMQHAWQGLNNQWEGNEWQAEGAVSHQRVAHLLKLVIGHNRSLVQELKGY